MIDTVQSCKQVLTRLSVMDYEKTGGSSTEQLIFPLKNQAQGTEQKDRISEQELRLLSIEELKKQNPIYSIQTKRQQFTNIVLENHLKPLKPTRMVNLHL